MKLLVIGDVHAQLEDLADCVAFRDIALNACREHQPDMVVFLGDQYHNHSIKHVEVERFWQQFFSQLVLSGEPSVLALVGNHDRPGNANSSANAMQAHPEIYVVDRPSVRGNILFVPYYHDPKELVRVAQEHPEQNVLFCHSAFVGGHYDNGAPIKSDAFYGKDVATPDDIPQTTIVSGHIHKAARFGKVWYPGSPRWQTMGDANTERAIWVVSVDETGIVPGSDICIPTNSLRRTWQLIYTPESLCEKQFAEISKYDKVLVNIEGPVAFCEEAKRNLQARGFRVRAFPTDRRATKVSEAEGVGVAFEKHFASYRPKFSTSKELLRGLVRERLHV